MGSAILKWDIKYVLIFAGDIGLSVPTIRNWLSILEASRMVYLLPPYYNNRNTLAV
ncbi:MAG: hypothetical protein QME44_10635 [Thermodesulfobacteriota bacterium]|nr:hypothetical protein [Thermodesulfobacteriota bacterium]